MGLHTILIKNSKKYIRIAFFFLFLLFGCLCFADEWKTCKEKKTTYQYIVLSENGSGLYTFASSTTYIDGTVVFYCHAGESDKTVLNDIYTVCEKQLERDESFDILKYSIEYVQLLRSSKTITAIHFDTDSPEYIEPGFPLTKTHLYLSSWIKK